MCGGNAAYNQAAEDAATRSNASGSYEDFQNATDAIGAAQASGSAKSLGGYNLKVARRPAPAPEPPAPAYSPGPYGPRTTVTNALPSTDMPNAGGQAAGAAAETLQIPATMAKRSRGSYRTAGIGGLNVPGVG